MSGPPELPDGPPEHPLSGAGSDLAGGPSAEGDVSGPTPTSRRNLLIGGAVALVVLIVVAVVLATRPADPAYDDASRERFLSACTADGGEPVRSTCECLYDAIVADVPYDRFEEISDELTRDAAGLEQGQPLELPEDIQAKLDACR